MTSKASTFFIGWTRSSTRNKTYLPSDFVPSDIDVMCGRGRDCFNHDGNRRFRTMIDQSLPQYLQAETKTEKTSIVSSIVDNVRWSRSNMCIPMGAAMPAPIDKNDNERCALFIRFDRKKEQWFEIGDEAAREKVGQTIREMLIQRDPEKRAKKRRARALSNSSNRMASAVHQAAKHVFRAPDGPIGKLQPQQMTVDLNTAASIRSLLFSQHLMQVPSPQQLSSQPTLVPPPLPLLDASPQQDPVAESIPSSVMFSEPTMNSAADHIITGLEILQRDSRSGWEEQMDTFSCGSFADEDDDNNSISTDLFSVESADSNVFDLIFDIPTPFYPGETENRCPAA